MGHCVLSSTIETDQSQARMPRKEAVANGEQRRAAIAAATVTVTM